MRPRMPLEKIVMPVPRPRRIGADFGASYAAAAIVAFLFAASGPVAIILSVGARGGLAESDIASWIFAAFCLNSVISIAFTLAYRQPLVFLWSIPGAVLVGPALGHLSFPEVIGAFLATGLLMLVLGLSGWVRRAMEVVPMPIVMAMVAGVFLRFGVDLVLAFREALWIAAPMTAAFFLLTILPKLSRVLPPLIAALIAGGAAIALTGAFKPPAGALFALAAPNLYVPQFSWTAMVELVVPLAITVLVVQNAQGIAVLAANGHQAPINAITAACGVGSMITGIFGSVSTVSPDRLTPCCRARARNRGTTAQRSSSAYSRSLSVCSRHSSRGCSWRRRPRSSPRSPASPCCASCRLPSPLPSAAASASVR
jgi:benzoate membrane transport protein